MRMMKQYIKIMGKDLFSRRGRAGQAMVEYLIIAAVLIGAVAVLSVFLYTFREQSGRVLDLVASDYP